MKCYVDLPYPEIRVEKENIEYAKILLNSYAGKISEDSAAHLYIFQHIVLEDKYKQYSDILKGIGIVEMHHLELLGETIRKLGIEPVFMSYDKNKCALVPWRSNYINYNTNFKNIINIDIDAEEKAIEYYKYSIKIIKDKYIRKLIERIIMDEELHLKIFKEIKKNIQ